MKKIMLVFGTRPEAIKMCPLVRELKRCGAFEVTVAVTGQHREMLDAVLRVFDVTPDYDLGVMREKQTLFEITSSILLGMERVLEQASPELVLVHGDTTTAFAAALAAYYKKIPVGHVEAGLRTGNLYAPYPEEFNRMAVGNLAALHFAPTEAARENLLQEGKSPDTVYVTGNTAIDALKTTVRREYTHPLLEKCNGRRMILLTAHRRENVGAPMARMFSAVKRFAMAHEDVFFVYPVHPNPAVREAAQAALSHIPNVALTEPLSVIDFHNFMSRAALVLTDSGGAQEEAPFFGVPVLVMREETERQEGVRAGTAMLVGSDEEKILCALETLFADKAAYLRMSAARNPYGDGFASQKICEIICKRFKTEALDKKITENPSSLV